MASTKYVIYGYDLTGCKGEKYDEWEQTEEWKDYVYNQRKGELQLFDDLDGNFFLGYILAMVTGYDEVRPIQYSIEDLRKEEKNLSLNLLALQKIGVIKDTGVCNSKYKLIIFDE